jgi:hypothetical protein
VRIRKAACEQLGAVARAAPDVDASLNQPERNPTQEIDGRTCAFILELQVLRRVLVYHHVPLAVELD